MTVKERARDETARKRRTIPQRELCEVIDVHPHKEPYPADKFFNVCTLRLKDQRDQKKRDIIRTRVNVLQRDHGHRWGRIWTPRKGDLVLVDFLDDERAVILGTLPSFQQEPVCRPMTDCECHEEYDEVWKLCQWEEPKRDGCTPNSGNFVYFPEGKRPECFKWFHKKRDLIFVKNCIEGHIDPTCKNCDDIDFVQAGSTWIKFFSDDTESIRDPANRLKIHHISGSTLLFDDDGLVYLENRAGEAAKGHFKMFPDGEIEIQSRSYQTDICGCGATGWSGGARGQFYPDGHVIFENLQNYAKIEIKSNGEIELNRNGGSIRILEDGTIKLSSNHIIIDTDDLEIQGAGGSISSSSFSISSSGPCYLENQNCPAAGGML